MGAPEEHLGTFPETWVIPGGIRWFHLMGVPPVRPENEQPVKEWLDVGYHRAALRKDLQQATVHLRAGQRVGVGGGGCCSCLEPPRCTVHPQKPTRGRSSGTQLPPTPEGLKINSSPWSASPWRWEGSY